MGGPEALPETASDPIPKPTKPELYFHEHDENPADDIVEPSPKINESAMAASTRRSRPISARPPPPKQKAPKAIQEQATREVGSIITDGAKIEEDDDDFLVKVIENTPKKIMATVQSLNSEQHGVLFIILRWSG
jgi:hypothetical protein